MVHTVGFNFYSTYNLLDIQGQVMNWVLSLHVAEIVSPWLAKNTVVPSPTLIQRDSKSLLKKPVFC